MKADIKSIEGYEGMTPEQKVAALEAYEFAERTDVVSKAQFDKTASELAAANKKIRESMSEADRREAERAQELTDLKAQLAQLQTEKTQASYKAKFLAMGMDEATSQTISSALTEGRTDDIFSALPNWISEHDKAVTAGLMKDTPKPPAGGQNVPLTKEAFRKLSAADRFKFMQDNPEEYKKIYGG